MKNTPCKTTNCKKWANLNSDGYCPKCASTENDDDCVGCLCSICNSEIQEEDNKIIGCDLCDNWYHAKCTGCPDELLQIMNNVNTDNDDQGPSGFLGNLIWVCPECNTDSPKTISITKNACKSIELPAKPKDADKVIEAVDTGDTNASGDSHKSEQKKQVFIPICKNYRYGTCNDGNNCKYGHPSEMFELL